MDNLFAGLISSKTRIKLLVRFFFNPQTQSYLRELSKEFNVSTNSVREELNQLTKTKLLKSQKSGRQVLYTANTKHPLFTDLKSMVGKVMGIDQVIDGIVNRLGDLEKAYLIDENCPTLGLRKFRLLNKAFSLRKHAMTLGYSSKEVMAYVESKTEQNRFRAIAEPILAKRGVKAGDDESYCTVGRAEIKQGSFAGSLLYES